MVSTHKISPPPSATWAPKLIMQNKKKLASTNIRMRRHDARARGSAQLRDRLAARLYEHRRQRARARARSLECSQVKQLGARAYDARAEAGARASERARVACETKRSGVSMRRRRQRQRRASASLLLRSALSTSALTTSNICVTTICEQSLAR